MISHRPTGDQRFVEPIRYWRPVGSQTVFWVQEMPSSGSGVYTTKLLPMIKWGNEIYLGVEDGIRIALCVYNGRSTWVAYPTFVGGANLWDGGPSQPELCTPSHMWEVQPYGSMVMDAVMNPGANRGRPLQIVRSGQGVTVSEAKFGTQAYRGDIAVYEKFQLGGGYRRRPLPIGGEWQESYRPQGPPVYRDDSTRGGAPLGTKGGSGAMPAARDPDTGRAGIGLGREEYRGHRYTGVQYQQSVQQLVFLRTEFRSDLQRELGWALGQSWYWSWSLSTGQWWNDPWTWRPQPGPTAPEVPVAPRPHRPGWRR